MTCTEPKQAYYPLDNSKSSKLLFNASDPNAGEQVTIPCRGCMHCKVKRAQGRAFLLYAEAYYHRDMCCVTLTYDSDNLPEYGNLTRGQDGDVAKFIKALKDKYSYKYKENGKWYKKYTIDIKYFNAAEYGEKKGRPHHHVIIFGYDFPDKVKSFKKGRQQYYSSKLLDSLWKKGKADIGSVHEGTCKYVSQYVLKKEFGKKGKKKSVDDGYFDIDTGEFALRESEHHSMSKGIGRKFYEENKGIIYPADFVTMSGSDFKFSVPEIYDKWLAVDDPEMLLKIKEVRKRKAEANERKLTKHDFEAMDKHLRARIKLYNKRSLE